MYKEEFLHLTHISNINSILKYGILPSHIDNNSHWRTFQKHGLKQRKCVYTWNGENYNNTKYVKDMIYCKFFIHPRNKFYNYTNEYLNFYDYGNKIFGEDCSFLLLKINHNDWLGDWTHCQYSGDEKYNTTTIMNDKYAHEDKKIYVSKEKITTFKIIEKINVRIYKNNTLGFSFSKII
jgi:hypothetical protein